MPVEPRFDTMTFSNEANKIDKVGEASGLPLVGLIDEESGGIVGYVTQDIAEEIVPALNKLPEIREALHIEAGFREEKAVELEENEEGVYEPGDIQAQRDRATALVELAR